MKNLIPIAADTTRVPHPWLSGLTVATVIALLGIVVMLAVGVYWIRRIIRIRTGSEP